jgi:hypothetical protein
MAVEDGGHGRGELGDGFDGVERAGGDEGGEQRPVLGADLMACEETVLPRQGYRTDESLDGVGVQLAMSPGAPSCGRARRTG